MALDGFAIEVQADYNDPNYGAIIDFAEGVQGLGNIAVNLPLIINLDLLGGTPNDGLIPTAYERLPDKPAFRTVQNWSHNDVLVNGQDIIDGMNRLTGR